MQKTDPNEYAFPTGPAVGNGLTIREFFAAQALQGILASAPIRCSDPVGSAKKARDCADALIAELNKYPAPYGS